MEKGRVIYRGAARAYDVSRSIARTIGLAYFDGHSSGETKYSIERAIFEEVTAKLAGGEIAGNKKADNGVFLQTMRKKLGIIQRD